MAELTTLARPYAKAVFDLATSNKNQQDWARILSCLSLTAEDVQVARLLMDPNVTKSELVELFNEVCDVFLKEQ